MPGPSTSVLDSFTRADENPLSGGGNWFGPVLSGQNQLKLVSNQIASTSGVTRGSGYWTPSIYTDSEAFMTFSTVPTTDGAGVYVRLTSPGSGSASGYMGWFFPGSGFRLWRLDNGTLNVIGGYSGSTTLAAGDKIWLRATGSSIVLAQFHSGSWTDVVTVTDSTYTQGYIGIFGAADTGWRSDDFGGGSINGTSDQSPTPTASVRDSAVRADENPLSDGGKWTNKVFSTDNNLKLASNKILATSLARGGAYWNVGKSTDGHAFVTVDTLPTADGVGLWLRVNNPNAGSLNGYFAWFFPGSGLRIWRVDSATATALTGYSTATFSAGDKIGFFAVGSLLWVSIYHGGQWTLVRAVTDTTYAGPGYIGIFGGADTTYRLSDFGGTVPAAATPGTINSTSDTTASLRLATPHIAGATINATSAMSADISTQPPRLSQETVEVLVTVPGDVRVSQDTVEVLASVPGDARVSQIAVEVLISSHFIALSPLTFAGTSTLSTVVDTRLIIPVTFSGSSSFSESVDTRMFISPTFAGTSTLTESVTSVAGTRDIPVTFAGTSSFSASVEELQIFVLDFAGTSSFMAGMQIKIPVTFAGTSTFGTTPLLRRISFDGTSTFDIDLTNFVTMGGILSQVTVEIVKPPSAQNAILSQATVEVAAGQESTQDVFQSQTTVEAAKQPLSAARLAKLSQVTVELVRPIGNLHVWQRYGTSAEALLTAAEVDSELVDEIGGTPTPPPPSPAIRPIAALINATSQVSAALAGGTKQIDPATFSATSQVTATVRTRGGIHPATIHATSTILSLEISGLVKHLTGSTHATSNMTAVLRKTSPFFVAITGDPTEGSTMTIVVTP